MFDHILRELPHLSGLGLQEAGGWTLFIDMILGAILLMYWERTAETGHARQRARVKKHRR